MGRFEVFTKSVMAGALLGALLWAAVFFARPSHFPASFWLRTEWFWSGVARGVLAGWVLGVAAGALAVSAMTLWRKLGGARREGRAGGAWKTER